MPSAGYMEVKVSGQTHKYANKKKTEINQKPGMNLSWDEVCETGVSMIEDHGPEIVNEYVEESDKVLQQISELLADQNEKMKRKGFTISDDVHSRGMDLRDEVTWNEIVQVGVNVLHERHVLNEGGESNEGPSEERIREIVAEMLDAYDDRASEIAREEIVDNVREEARK